MDFDLKTTRDYLQRLDARCFNSVPQELKSWYEALYTGGLSDTEIALLVQYFTQKKVARQTEKRLLDEIRLIHGERASTRHLREVLNHMCALGYVLPSGRHDARGRFCSTSFVMCAMPPRIPISHIRTVLMEEFFYANYQETVVANIGKRPDSLAPSERGYLEMVVDALGNAPSTDAYTPQRVITPLKVLLKGRKKALEQMALPQLSKFDGPKSERRRRGRPARRRRGVYKLMV